MKKKKKPKLLVDKPFSVASYSIAWTAADPSYKYALDLVPIIVLFESNDPDDHSAATAFVRFRQKSQVKGASYDSERNIYNLDYPRDFAGEVLRLLALGVPLTVTYKRQGADIGAQTAHEWITIATTDRMPLIPAK